MTRMSFSFPWFVLAADGLPATAQARPGPAEITAALTDPLGHVRFLADDASEGREARGNR